MKVFLASKNSLTGQTSLWQSRGVMSKSPTRKAVDEAIRASGSLKKVAERLGITSQAISQWDKIPPRHVLSIEALSGVSRHDLRPDIYGPAPKHSRSEIRAA